MVPSRRQEWAETAAASFDDFLDYIASTPRGNPDLRATEVHDAVDALVQDYRHCRVRRRTHGVELRRYVTERETSIVFSVEEVGGTEVLFVRYVTHAHRRRLYPPDRDVQPFEQSSAVPNPRGEDTE